MNEALIITQILEKNGKSFALLIPYGSQFEDLYAVLKDFESANKEKEEQARIAAQEAELAKGEQVSCSEPIDPEIMA